ncbi:hypothetical protein ASO20_01500 [Mycoplasma sp. (ex Biomphalaria glabrata)]|uniref:ParA family protein n=1 Tax=Mycoplasma sp. (ex Biomphalaria glabrata) TaxID=1749074 RepID=UPI00073A84E5|nr:ParA family protein [Mycoplasma sp. (ex Biomphalaria glabrata)]ALV23326.1 hypothetical protein ASO20_01500 [Mycoplasma sp. (ex Biomphalaria glabrata)]
MGKVIAITNQKGGVGKTTTSINLAHSLSKKGHSVLLIDLDPQANATTGLGVNKEEIKNCAFNLIVDDLDMKSVMLPFLRQNLSLIPSTINLAGVDIYLAEKNQLNRLILKEKIDQVKDQYDYVIIDCPPSLGILNRSALAACDSVIIPVQPEFYALEGLTQLLSTINIVKRLENENIKIEGILITMFDQRSNLSNEIINEIEKYFKGKVYKTKIPRSIRISEAQSGGKTIFEHDINNKTSIAYDLFTEEVISNNGNSN